MTVNVGVIGVGMIGQEHIRRLMTTVPGAKVVAVSDVDEARAREAASFLSGVQVYALGEDLILAREVEAVIVASWGPTHAALCAGGDQGRQAGLLREAARDHGSGLFGDPRRRGRLRPPAGAGRVHAPVRSAVSGDEGDDRIGGDRRAAHLPERPSQRVGAGALHRRHGADRHRGARHRHRPLPARRRAGRDHRSARRGATAAPATSPIR